MGQGRALGAGFLPSRQRSPRKETDPEQESRYLRSTFPRASVFQGLGKGPAGGRAQGRGQRAKGLPRGRNEQAKGDSDQKRDADKPLPGRENPCDRATEGEGEEGAYPKKLHGHKAEPLLLEALDDVAHQAALHAVRLDGDEGALRVGHGPEDER